MPTANEVRVLQDGVGLPGNVLWPGPTALVRGTSPLSRGTPSPLSLAVRASLLMLCPVVEDADIFGYQFSSQISFQEYMHLLLTFLSTESPGSRWTASVESTVYIAVTGAIRAA